MVLTIYGEVDPRAVDVVLIITIQEHNGALVPSLVIRTYIHYPNASLLH